MAQISSALLNTKLFIPRIRPDLIRRARLTEQLRSGAWRALTLVSAPAGFGKTTVVADWVRESGWNAAWVSLDEGDNEVSRFLSYLTLALREIGDIGETALDALQASHATSVEAVLTGLLNEVATLPDDFIVVLDDYHIIVAQPVHDALDYLLEHIPPQMHLVIATRADPPLPVSRLRVRGQMTEVRAVDLRFTEDETSTYLNDLMGLGLSLQQIKTLEARTEGWIGHPRLCLYYALTLQATGQLEAVEPLLEIAESNQHLAPHTSVTAHANAIRSYEAGSRRNYSLAIYYAQRVIRSLPSGENTPELLTLDDDLIARGRAFLGMAEAYMGSGELTKAERILSETITENQRAGNLSATAGAIANRVTAMAHMGRLKAALEVGYQGLDLLRRWPGRNKSGGRSLMADAQLYLHVGRLLYESNDLAESETYAHRTIEHHELGGRVNYGITGYSLLADLMLASGDLDGALSKMQKLDVLRANLGDTYIGLRARTDVLRMTVRLRLASSKPEFVYLTEDVATWAEAQNLTPDDELDYSREPVYLLLARLLIMQERPGEALPMLGRLVHASESTGRVGDQISYLVTLALALSRDGEAATALATVTQALSHAEPEGYIRTFVDCGQDMQRLLQLVAKRGTGSNYVSKLLEAFDPLQGEGGLAKAEKSGSLPVQPESSGRRSLPEPLNERELSILKFMAVRLSNREIASELYLSVNTVRWHAHNLFGKLGVGGRAEAVSGARDMNLL